METQRQLIHVPIIHTEAEMGGLGKTLSRVALREFGEQARWKKQDFTSRMWDSIEKMVQDLNLPLKRVRLYQDGLPECGKEEDIVRDLAGKGSRNHQLLVRLMEKGATLMGTESPDLIVKEYNLVKQMMSVEDDPDPSGTVSSLKVMSRKVLSERDQYIARRINSTLAPGEAGLLFLGMLHNLEGMLDEDINVSYPLYKPSPTS